MLECVIFDLDGLMVDSEPLQFRAYREAFASFNFELTLERWRQWHALEASPRRWVEIEGLDFDAEALRDRKKTIYDDLIARQLRLKPGVRRLVEELSSAYRLGVASGSRRESIEGCLDRFSLLSHFDQLCPANEVKRSKPFPDVYLRALELLDASPVNTIALEDSPTGLRAAQAAGIACVVCPDAFMPQPESAFEAAALRIETLREIDAAALQNLLAERARPP